MQNYGYIKKSPFSFFETVDEVRIAFAEKGFGVVSNVDIAEKIKKKIHPNFGEYTTLGFCNPDLAYKYLQEDINLGIFMPCSVSIYEKNSEVFIVGGLPEIIIEKIIKNKNLEKMNFEISKNIKEIIDSI